MTEKITSFASYSTLICTVRQINMGTLVIFCTDIVITLIKLTQKQLES